MSISNFEINGMMSRTQDYSIYKVNEDNKGALVQNAILTDSQKELESKLNRVEKPNQSEKGQNNQDAKEKGKNEYQGDGGKNRKKEEIPIEGKVVKKSATHFEWRV